MKPKELSEVTGVKERTIRFYEEQGMLQPRMERKNGRNFREYSEEDVQRLRNIVSLRKAKFTLDEIRDVLDNEDALETIFPAYLQRVREEAETASALRALVEGIDRKGMKLLELRQQLEKENGTVEIPATDISLQFGRFDDESQEEKQKAVEEYYARHNFKELLFCYIAMRRRNLMKLFRKSDKKNKEDAKKGYRQGIYSGTAVEHTYVKGGVRDGSLSNPQKLAVLQMLREEDK